MGMPEDLLLPYRTDWREMRAVLEYCKGKGVDRGVLEARFGAGESLRETLNALEQLGLVERSEGGDVRLTEAGDALAYAPDTAQLSERLVDALVAFAPYRYPLERAVADASEVLDGPWVEHIWQVDMRLGQPRNRVEEARTFFFRLADEAGLGTYRRGVRGQTTRLDLADTFLERVGAALGRWTVATAKATLVASTTSVAPSPPTTPPFPAAGAAQTAALPLSMRVAPTTPVGAPAELSIHVDMSEWELEKIAAFLRLIGYPLAESGRDEAL